ncbi:cupin domain-containing protein [Lacticaseibacillus suihuaensis]
MQTLALAELIDYRDHQIASKSFGRKLNIALPFVAYALDAGESISNEQSTLTRLIQVVDGTLTVVNDGVPTAVPTGAMIVIPAGTPHALEARTRCKFIQMETAPRG